MPYPEGEPKTHRSEVDNSLDRIIETGIEGVSPMAEKIKEEVRIGTIKVKRAPEYAPWLANFHLLPFTLDPRETPHGVIEVRITGNAGSDRLDGEMVRTLLVADQYLDEDYDKPLRQIYKKAIDGQWSWLDQTGNGAFLDPRNNEENFILAKLIGRRMLYFDFGFAEWQDAVFAHNLGVQVSAEALGVPNSMPNPIELDWVDSTDSSDPVIANDLKALVGLRFDPVRFRIAREKLWQSYLSVDSAGMSELPELAESNRSRFGALNAVILAVGDK